MAPMTAYRRPPPDFPRDIYSRKMMRRGRDFSFVKIVSGGRDDIWKGWTDGCEVGLFVARAREISGGGGGIEDVRIYIHHDLVRFDPPLTDAERSRVRPPRSA
jgi:hypothetical protein